MMHQHLHLYSYFNNYYVPYYCGRLYVFIWVIRALNLCCSSRHASMSDASRCSDAALGMTSQSMSSKTSWGTDSDSWRRAFWRRILESSCSSARDGFWVLVPLCVCLSPPSYVPILRIISILETVSILRNLIIIALGNENIHFSKLMMLGMSMTT